MAGSPFCSCCSAAAPPASPWSASVEPRLVWCQGSRTSASASRWSSRHAGLQPATPRLVLLFLVLTTAVLLSLPFCLPSSSTPLQVTPIFANGSMMGAWHQNSVGCRTCNQSDTEGARHGSTASFSVHMAERGHLRFTSESPHPSDRCGEAGHTHMPCAAPHACTLLMALCAGTHWGPVSTQPQARPA